MIRRKRVEMKISNDTRNILKNFSTINSGIKVKTGNKLETISNMKNILGYLNQSEWVYSLNIGNIMQISPLTLQDFLSQTAI